MLPRPKAVIISDIHFNLNTLDLASKALQMAVDKANELDMPLIIAGDLHDTKANIRAECITAILKVFRSYDVKGLRPVVLVGNHDKVNEKSENHALDFLKPLCWIIEKIEKMPGLYLVPYHHDLDALRAYIGTIEPNSTLLMHQGLVGTIAGHYIQDPTALSHSDVARFNVISGHYHRRQTIDTGFGHTWDYIGNPYTLNFGEANDPIKGFQVLNEDHSLTFIPTNLRKHVVIELDLRTGNNTASSTINTKDLVLVKASGTKDEQRRFDKAAWALNAGIPNDFRLDFITINETLNIGDRENKTQTEILDTLIEILPEDVSKDALKALWRLLSEDKEG